MRDVVSFMVYFWFSITENHENHSRDILVQAIDNQAIKRSFMYKTTMNNIFL